MTVQHHHSIGSETSPDILRFCDLDVAAVRLRARQRDRQLIFWYALRTGQAATGYVGRSAIHSARTSLGISRRTCQRLVAAGAPIFWVPDGTGGLYLRAPARVASALGVTSFRTALICSLRRLRGPIATVRARLALQGVAAIRRGLPTSNAVIAEMLDASVRTVRLWRRPAGVRVRPNFALVAPLGRTDSVAGFFHTTGEPGLRAVKYGRRTWLARQLPNTFSVPPSHGVRSTLRRVNRHLRRLTGAKASSDTRGGGNVWYCRADRHRARPSPDPTLPSAATGGMVYVPVGTSRMNSKRISLWKPDPTNR